VGSLESLAMIELSSIARGYKVVDAAVKRSPIKIIEANRVEPGKYLFLFGGGVAEVEEAFVAAMDAAGAKVVDKMLLPMVHEAILPAFSTRSGLEDVDTIGVVESASISSGLVAVDRCLKDSSVELCGLRVTPGLGGKLIFVVHGAQHDVEVAMELSRSILGGALVDAECIANPHQEFIEMVLRPAPFSVQERS
jgi:microcompartment protein CcmL/EutN